MRHAIVKSISGAVLPLISVLMVTGTAAAVDVYLRAEALSVDMPHPSGVGVVPIAMWGFARDDAFEGAELELAAVPGPQITVPSGDTTLTIHLDNNLTVPISIQIRGQQATMTPVFMADPDGTGRPRVRSFTHETPAGNAAEVTYTWTGMKPGTYLYRSATHVQVQVQMGLYGAAIVESATAGQAYDDPSSAYDHQVVLLYSEIDPALHAAVDSGDYVPFGDPESQMTSTIHYKPKYFLINGAPYTAATAPLAAGSDGDRVLLRFLNAGLRVDSPTLLNGSLSVLAEDGQMYSAARKHHTLGLPPGQTRDAIVTLPAGSYPLYDRSAGLTNAGGALPGGMLRILEVAP